MEDLLNEFKDQKWDKLMFQYTEDKYDMLTRLTAYKFNINFSSEGCTILSNHNTYKNRLAVLILDLILEHEETATSLDLVLEFRFKNRSEIYAEIEKYIEGDFTVLDIMEIIMGDWTPTKKELELEKINNLLNTNL